MAQPSAKKIFQPGIFGARIFAAGVFRGRLSIEPVRDRIMDTVAYINTGIDRTANVGATQRHEAGIKRTVEFEAER